MKIQTTSQTTTTCSIDLSDSEQFDYKQSWWSRPVKIIGLRLKHSHFEMVYRDIRGVLQIAQRDSYRENIHFDLDDVPQMPMALRVVVQEKLDELQEQNRFVNSPSDMLF